MNFEEFKELISSINLVKGKIEIKPGSMKVVSICLYSEDIDPSNLGKISIGFLLYVEFEILSRRDILKLIQEAWTQLWIHESLETFQYKNQKIFDPHSVKTNCNNLNTSPLLSSSLISQKGNSSQ